MYWQFLFGYRISKKSGVEIDPVKGSNAQDVFSGVANGESLNSVVRRLKCTSHFGALGRKWQTPWLRLILSNVSISNLIQRKGFIPLTSIGGNGVKAFRG